MPDSVSIVMWFSEHSRDVAEAALGLCVLAVVLAFAVRYMRTRSEFSHDFGSAPDAEWDATVRQEYDNVTITQHRTRRGGVAISREITVTYTPDVPWGRLYGPLLSWPVSIFILSLPINYISKIGLIIDLTKLLMVGSILIAASMLVYLKLFMYVPSTFTLGDEGCLITSLDDGFLPFFMRVRQEAINECPREFSLRVSSSGPIGYGHCYRINYDIGARSKTFAFALDPTRANELQHILNLACRQKIDNVPLSPVEEPSKPQTETGRLHDL